MPRKDVTIDYTSSSDVTYRSRLGGCVAAAVLVPPSDAFAKVGDFRELADFAKEYLVLLSAAVCP